MTTQFPFFDHILHVESTFLLFEKFSEASFTRLQNRFFRFFDPCTLSNHTVSFESTRKRVVTHFDSGTVTLNIKYDQIIINYPILGEIIRLTDQIGI